MALALLMQGALIGITVMTSGATTRTQEWASNPVPQETPSAPIANGFVIGSPDAPACSTRTTRSARIGFKFR
ncbi:MAG: hypothetical protein HY706_00725 [Candidatus Hydrogenedentes bacterium]|nr:hypothetical protein [Candidatus Hydrogenedentota bacterium]